jgi:periodic tryptophan protein 2
VAFDPFDLSVDLTPQSVLDMLASGEYLKAFIMAFRLNEKPLIHRVFESIPLRDIRLVVRQSPVIYVQQLLRFIAEHLEKSPHLEFDLLWVDALLGAHGRYLREKCSEYANVFRALQKALTEFQESVSKL